MKKNTKTKRAWLFIAAIIAMSMCATGLVACGEHEHQFVNYVYNDDATCGKDGTETAKCETCDKTDTRKSEEHPATGDHVYNGYSCKVCFEYAPNAPITHGLLYYEILENNHVVAYEVGEIGSATGTEILIPKTHNDKPVTLVGGNAFGNCGELLSVTIPNSVTKIGHFAFFECTALTNVTIPNSVTIIDKSAFRNCYSLTNLEIPESVVSIGEYAFCGAGLVNVTIPKSVTRIEYYAFTYCANLSNIVYNGTVEEWKAISKGSYWNNSAGNYTVTCTDGVLNKAESE